MVEITDIKNFKKNVMTKLRGYRKQDKVILACNPNINKNKQLITYEECVKLVQQLDPAGVGARNLKECLLIQLNRKKEKPNRNLAISSRHYMWIDSYTNWNFRMLLPK